MRVKLKVSGGVAGIQHAEQELDSSSLSAAEAALLQKLVEDSQFFDLPEMNLSRAGRDLMQYTITVEGGNKRHQVTVDEMSTSRKVLDIINRLARD